MDIDNDWCFQIPNETIYFWMLSWVLGIGQTGRRQFHPQVHWCRTDTLRCQGAQHQFQTDVGPPGYLLVFEGNQVDTGPGYGEAKKSWIDFASFDGPVWSKFWLNQRFLILWNALQNQYVSHVGNLLVVPLVGCKLRTPHTLLLPHKAEAYTHRTSNC